MAVIKLTGILSEGTHTFRIDEVNYDEDFGKLEIKMTAETGWKHTERFKLLDSDGQDNPRARTAFSFFAKTAMNDLSLDDIDPDDLIGRYFEAEVKHTKAPSNKPEGGEVTFVNLGEKRPASRFPAGSKAEKGAPVKASKDSERVPVKEDDVDLNALLGL